MADLFESIKEKLEQANNNRMVVYFKKISELIPNQAYQILDSQRVELPGDETIVNLTCIDEKSQKFKTAIAGEHANIFDQETRLFLIQKKCVMKLTYLESVETREGYPAKDIYSINIYKPRPMHPPSLVEPYVPSSNTSSNVIIPEYIPTCIRTPEYPPNISRKQIAHEDKRKNQREEEEDREGRKKHKKDSPMLLTNEMTSLHSLGHGKEIDDCLVRRNEIQEYIRTFDCYVFDAQEGTICVGEEINVTTVEKTNFSGATYAANERESPAVTSCESTHITITPSMSSFLIPEEHTNVVHIPEDKLGDLLCEESFIAPPSPTSNLMVEEPKSPLFILPVTPNYSPENPPTPTGSPSSPPSSPENSRPSSPSDELMYVNSSFSDVSSPTSSHEGVQRDREQSDMEHTDVEQTVGEVGAEGISVSQRYYREIDAYSVEEQDGKMKK